MGSTSMALAPGTRLGPYEILSPLGAGGMGEVYKARDARLGREVAVKVLPESLAGDAQALSRFEKEAKAIAALSHPNILSIFDFGTAGGTTYAVTELLEGSTLRDALDRPLPAGRTIDFALQIVKGLCAAHEKGIVHRDLKPENLFVTRDGNMKILDFGLAKSMEPASADLSDAPTGSAKTSPGTVMGTVAYMSPEQVRGRPVDPRSDIFSFGSILYEMLTGKKPFRKDSPAETMAAILMEEPPDPSESVSGCSPALGGIVRHCLEKNVDRRYQTARDLLFTLQQFGSGASTAPTPAAATPSVAVLPFLSFSADPENEFFAEGMTEDVIAHLAKIRSLKVISRTSVMPFKKRDRSLREIGKTLGADSILDGSIRRAGNRVRIVAQLVDVATDEHLWADTYDRELTDIFAIQTDVALQIAASLQAELSPDERSRIEKKPTRNAHAYQLYMQGMHAFYRNTDESYRQAIAYFDQAIAEDPGIALAHTALAALYVETVAQGLAILPPKVAFRKAKEAVDRALELDDTLGDAHCVAATLMFMGDYDWAGAEREFRLALELAPGNSEIYDKYGWMCSALGRHEDAIRMAKRAKELDPLANASDLGTELLRAGRYPEALDEARRLIEFEPGLTRGHSIKGWAHVLMGDFDAGLAALGRAVAIAPENTLFYGQLGEAYALAGRAGEAREVLRKLHALARERYVSPYHFAYVHAGLGEQDEAMDWLEKAYEQRTGAIYGIKGSFLFIGLREHPRFKALLAKMNLA
jgi:serine/threonine-protein kinase